MTLTITQDDLRLVVQLLAAEVTDSDEWWDKATRGLLSRITGKTVATGCEECEGAGYKFNGSREVECKRCDGLGFLTDETVDRECAYCTETDGDQLDREDGVWLCDDEQCAIDHAKAFGVPA